VSAPRRATRLALFDLDNTLIGGDSDYGWAKFLIQEGVLDGADYERRNAQFFADYKSGTLDIFAFLDFQLKPLSEHPLEALLAWRARFVAQEILPLLLPAAQAVVDEHRAAGDLIAVVTATNSFITRPIADLYGI
jgi:phosphoserine phosphatase